MVYEEMTGETYPITLQADSDLYGSSTDWEGADETAKTVTVRWQSPGGIIGQGWEALSTDVQSTVEGIIDDTTKGPEQKISEINQAIYNYVSYLMEPGGASYDDFADSFIGTNCIVINR